MTWDLPDHARLRELLAIFGFDLSRARPVEGASVACGDALEPLAGDFAGGLFYLCGDLGAERPVLYASSEGQAGLIADDPREALQLVIGLPHWHDCLTFNDFERKSAPTSQQAEAADLLGLRIPAQEVLLERLRAAVLRSTPDYVFTDETGEYEPLIPQPERAQ
ncbi:hypothetical protein GCM10011609_59030 [Lentzea pudingi]|uniref:Immunity protein Imm1 n=1 Tax=Lentzea pudingi TaxID=1789439 RepID=A0ABQ2IMA9_9PSEU|nr:hypothetical protein [Lentzea pudingi]GGN11219.1 hypothetical protein GCM10011609_59030 [Lentzea pudingi]